MSSQLTISNNVKSKGRWDTHTIVEALGVSSSEYIALGKSKPEAVINEKCNAEEGYAMIGNGSRHMTAACALVLARFLNSGRRFVRMAVRTSS